MASCSAGDGDGGTAPGPAWSVDFSASTLTFTAIDAVESVTATVRDTKGKSIPDASVTWSSENPTIADVSGGGRTVSIIARSPGSTNIRARSGSLEATLVVTVYGVNSVQVSMQDLAMRIGESATLSAQVSAGPGVSQAVTWSSGNAAVATVDDQGKVTAVSPGATTIQATAVADKRHKATAQVVVAPERGIVLSPTVANMNAGQVRVFSATVSLPAGQSTAVTWKTSDPQIATVSSQGVVTAIAIGNAIITAEAVADETLKATAQVNVVPAVHSVSVSPQTAQVYVGETQVLTATVNADGGLAQTVHWRTSNPTVASVGTTGIVTGVATGNATITAVSTVDTTKRASATVSVAMRPVGVVIDQRNVALTIGGTQALTATVTGSPGINTAVTWSTSAPQIVAVSGGGVVTGIAGGSALITATSVQDNTRKDTVTVFVNGSLASTWSASRLNGPLYEDVLSMYVAGPNDAYAVNLMGDVFRYNGTSWTRVLTGSTYGTSFRAVHGSSANNIFAVGTNGKIMRWQGSSWNGVASGTTRHLNAVHVASATVAFAVGDEGAAVRFNGTTWTVTNTGTTERLNDVWSVEGGGIAVTVGENGTALLLTGGNWISQDLPTTEHLHGVTGPSSSEVYVVGDFGTVFRFNGTTWSEINSGLSADLLAAVTSPSDNTVYAVGSFGTVVQFIGANILPIETPYVTRLYSAAFADNGTMWTAGQRGIVQRRASSDWTVLNLAPDLIDVWSTSNTNAWAVGEFGFIYRWNGTTWQRQESPTRERLNTVWGVSATSAFAGGDGGLLLRWNGTSWLPMSFPSENDVLAIWGTSANNVWAVTFGGEILHFDGTFWSEQKSQDKSLYGVYGSGANNVYAIGDQGTVWRYNGSAWTQQNVAAGSLLVGLWSAGPSSAISVGLSAANPLQGAAYVFNGSSWAPSNLSGGTPELTSVWGPNASDLYATGGAGTILRYTGTQWQSMTTGTNDYLWAVTGAPNGVGGAFAVGYNTTVVAGSNIGAVAGMSVGPVQRSFNPSVRSAPVKIKRDAPTGSERTRMRR